MCKYWAHLGLTTYKKEVLSIRQLEAMAEKQPRSRKELSMLYTDKQLMPCLLRSALTGGTLRRRRQSQSDRRPQSLSNLLHSP